MQIHILGSGSASDPTLPNSSIVVTCGDARIMIDCGYSVAREAIAAFRDPGAVDVLVFTHHHPDHCYGFVPTMIAWSDAGRRKPLTIATTDWGRRQLMELQRLGLGSDWRPGFDYRWHPVPEPLALGPARLRFAPTDHTVPNFAIRIEAGGAALAYSGDGRPTAESRALFAGADLLLHECYTLAPLPDEAGHCSFDTCRAMLENLPLGRLLLYHIREDQRPAVAAAAAAVPRLGVAVTGSTIELPGGAASQDVAARRASPAAGAG
jgi:ribonuclease BN (tRNA processing enzyme)